MFEDERRPGGPAFCRVFCRVISFSDSSRVAGSLSSSFADDVDGGACASPDGDFCADGVSVVEGFLSMPRYDRVC